jgi:hypothetical protein
MIAPVNVAPALPPTQQTSPAQKVAYQSLDLDGASSPDLNAAPRLKKTAGQQARSTVPNFSQNLSGSVANRSINDLLANPTNPTRLAQAQPAAPTAPVEAQPVAPAPSGTPTDMPPLNQIPTLQPEGVPTPIEPQSGGTPVPQAPADGVSQDAPLQPPSQVLPQQPTQPSQPPATGTPPAEPSNYLNNQPGNRAPYYNQNYVGPAVSFSRDTVIGATSRFGLGKNISVRPSLFLGNTTRIAVPFTYDFGFNEYEQFERNPLVVFHAGGGLDYSSGGGANGSRLNPLVVAGADMYFGEGASILFQVGNAFNSDFIGVVGVGLQF